MATEYRKATAAEYEDLIDFANMVFKTDFAALLPKLYFGHPEMAVHHYLALEDGKIRAAVGSFPLEFEMGGVKVRARGIGTVSVHPYSRGMGYMKELMNRAVADAKAEGTDLMCLGGQRQRYEYFGFSKACQQRSFTVTPTNRRHCRGISSDSVVLVPLAEHPEYEKLCWELHRNQPVHAVRPLENFTEICCSWSCQPWVILQDGNFAGYAVMKKDGTSIPELLLKEKAEVLPVVFALVQKAGCDVKFSPAFWQKTVISALSEVAESSAVQGGEMFQILNFPKMIEILLNQKAAQTGLPDGTRILGIEGGNRYQIAVSGQKAVVTETQEAADWTLDAVSMQSRLINAGNLWQYDTFVENCWFPLPLELPAQDMV
ncbi:MAG: GNAT family N-acetyltransferase [Candidatus Merdivicinus sp.]|jgi:predicted N-acetyltransferase YhbS